MEDKRLVEHLHAKLQDKLGYLKDDVGRGQAEDYANYKYICGKIRGINEAIDLLNSLDIEEDNDE